MRGAQLSGVVRAFPVAAALALFSLPASAQSVPLSAVPAHTTGQPALHSAIALQPSLVAAPPSGLVLPEHGMALQTSVGGAESPHAFAPAASLGAWRRTLTYRNIVAGMVGSVEEVETPFLNQVRVPLLSMGSGRVQLTGFQSVTPMVNVVWGLPLRASASGVSVVQLHPGVRVPRNNQSYGLSLRLRFSQQDTDRAGNGLWRAARQAATWGRGFFTF